MTEFLDNARLEARIDDLIQGAIEVCVATAFMDLVGARRFATFLRRITNNYDRRVRLLLSREFHESPRVQRQIAEELGSLPGVEVRIFDSHDRRLHAKVFLFQHHDIFHAIVGSANLTGAGLSHNVEAGLWTCGSQADSTIGDLVTFFERHWELALPVAEAIEEDGMGDGPIFMPGSRVVLVAEPSRRGFVVSPGRHLGGDYLFSVVFDQGGRGDFAQGALRLLAEDDILDLLRQGRFAEPGLFHLHLTAIKLSHPLVDNLYALAASRTIFQVHQFKPVVKLLANERRRLLIADEVGLGKTIEAGLIMAELASREPLSRVLVVCPSGLRHKWQAELAGRFDEQFEFIDSAMIQNWRRQWGTYGLHPPTLRCIASLEALREDANVEALKEMHLTFDLVIADEAHHMRNPDTESHKLGRLLSSLAGSMVLLTATPLQLGNQDLFNLLRVLDEEEFYEFAAFEELIRPNEYVNSALREIRPQGTDSGAVLNALRRVETTSLASRYTQHPYYRRACEALEDGNSLTLEGVADVRRRLIELNTLAHIFSRTRKRDVPIRWPKREPHTISVTLTSAEKAFYDGVTDFVRELFQRVSGSSRGLPFAIIMPQRQVASCIPAMRDCLHEMVENQKVGGQGDEAGDPTSEGDDAGRGTGVPLMPEEVRKARDLIRMVDELGGQDTKFERLQETLADVFGTGEVQKILIFTFFKRTLRYLHRRLAEAYGVEVIHGDVLPAERAERIRRFEANPGLQILLTTEVGGEGLDLQFANCMVNYDLPWNPMRVEQRIGRIDRYGQQSEKVGILNFSVRDTIETNIFHRLFERIGIFERSIGDLEAILGDEITRLTREVLSMKLTPAEEQERADRLALNMIARLSDMEQLEEEGKRFLGQDDFFFAEIESIRSGRRFIDAAELEQFLSEALRMYYPNARLQGDKAKSHRSLRVDGSLRQHLMAFTRQRAERQRVGRLPALLDRGDPIALTFDIELANRARDIEFVTARHPLIRAMLQAHKQHERAGLGVGRLVLRDASHRGRYVFIIYLFEATGLRPGPRLVAVAVNVETGHVASELSKTLLSLLSTATEAGGSAAMPEGEQLDRALRVAEEEVACLRRDQERVLAQENAELVELRLASLRQHTRIQIARHRRVLEENPGLPESIVTMRRRQMADLEEAETQKVRQLEASRQTSIGMTLVAGGFLEVTE